MKKLKIQITDKPKIWKNPKVHELEMEYGETLYREMNYEKRRLPGKPH